MKIIVVERNNDYKAHPEGMPGVWEAGATAAEAVGKLILIQGKEFGVEVKRESERHYCRRVHYG